MVYEATSGAAVSKLESTPFAGGRITASEGTNGAIYTAMNYVTDHLGSARVVVHASNGDVSSRNDYYAFGSRWSSGDQAISDNRYLYNGKESQSFADVDYGARMYDPELGRWFNNDPLAEKYYTMSPYVYCANNPIKYIDPDGRKIVDAKGNVIFKDGGWVKGVNPLLIEYTGAMRKRASGRASFKKIVASKDSYYFNLKGSHKTNKIILGSMAKGKSKDGNNFFAITIYLNNHHRTAKEDGVTYGTAIAGTMVHEIQHTIEDNLRMQREWETNDPQGKIDWNAREHEKDAEKARLRFINNELPKPSSKPTNFVLKPEFWSKSPESPWIP